MSNPASRAAFTSRVVSRLACIRFANGSLRNGSVEATIIGARILLASRYALRAFQARQGYSHTFHATKRAA